MRIFCLVPAALALLVAPSALAVEAEGEVEQEEVVTYPAFRVGVGVSLPSRPFVLLGDESTAGSPASMANVLIPMYLGKHLRLEAEFGMHTQSAGLLPGNSLLGVFDTELGQVHTSIFRALIGAAWATPLGENTLVYVGPKFGLQTRSMEFDLPAIVPASEADTTLNPKVKAVDFWLGAAVGGEAFLTRHFSLGLEVGLFYLNYGKSAITALREIDDEFSEHSEDSPWLIDTHGSIAARLYFL